MCFRAVVLTFATFTLSWLPMHAQEARGTLLGRVSDPSAAVISGVRLQALNVDTGVRFSSLSNRTGDYMFPLLVPGTYTITAENPGFKKYTRTGIVVRVNDQVTIDVQLEVGEASQSVNVSA